MKALNSWIAAAVTCSAMVSQANADVLLLNSGDTARDVAEVTGMRPVVGVDNARDEHPSRVRPVFVPGSLIEKSRQGTRLMSESVRHTITASPSKVMVVPFSGRHHNITPIPPAGTEMRPVSTFAQFAQTVKSALYSDSAETLVSDEDEIVPKTSNMTLIGLFTFSLAGITAVISASRRGYFGPTPRQRRSRMF